MHDPSTVAFEIRYPWNWKIFYPYLWNRNFNKNLLKHGKEKRYYHTPFITIWHIDPENDGTDDSCGYSYPKITKEEKILLKKEVKFSIDVEEFFDKEGNPKYDPLSSIIACFSNLAWKFYRKVLNPKQMIEVINVATNPIDNLRSQFEGKKNEEDIERIYFLVLRSLKRIIRPWYKYPKWHIKHWRLQIHPLQRIRRFLYDRCCLCGKRFGYKESPLSNWDGDKLWHSKCDYKLRPPVQV